MTRGLALSVALHVVVFVATLLGPSPKAFEWEPETRLLVELVTPPIELPPDKPVEAKAPPVREPLEAPVTEPLPEIPPETPEPPPEVKSPDPEPVRPRAKERPPRTFKRVAPPRKDDGPSLAERLQRRLKDVGETEPETPPDDAAPDPEIAPAAASTEVEAADFPFAWYLNQVQTRVRNAWDTPGDRLLSGGARPVGVEFVIHRDGGVSGIRIVAPSGTPGLDASAIRAVERAHPFPPLPEPYEGDELALTVRFRVSGGRP